MRFDFNLYSSLLLIGFIQGVVFAGLLFWRGFRERRLSDKLLASLLVVICLHLTHYMLGFAGWFSQMDHYTTFMFYFPIENLLLVGPLVYFYFRSLTNQHFRIRGKHWWHFVPGFLHLGLYALIFVRDLVFTHWIQGEPLNCFNNTKGQWACYYESYLETPIQMLWAISILSYLVWTLVNYQAYRRYLNDNFSEQEHIRFGWLRNLLLVLALGMAITWVFDLVSFVRGGELDYPIYWNTHLAMAIMVYYVSIQGYHHVRKLKDLDFVAGKGGPLTWRNEEEEQPTQVEVPETNAPVLASSGVQETNSELPNSRLSSDREIADLGVWKEKLSQFMESDHPYLNPELKLKELASAIQTNPSILSKVINHCFEQNFNDFINSRRVEAVKQRLEDPASAQYSLLGIAEECGFNSKSTFNRAFKKFSGMSPREYLRLKQTV